MGGMVADTFMGMVGRVAPKNLSHQAKQNLSHLKVFIVIVKITSARAAAAPRRDSNPELLHGGDEGPLGGLAVVAVLPCRTSLLLVRSTSS